MSKALELIGKRFGRLTVIKKVGNNKWHHILWLCKCDCGNEVTVVTSSLSGGLTKSCGCLRKETSKKILTTHGFSNTKVWRIYRDMNIRCSYKNSKHYKNYGGRGITVCDRWLGKNGFINFLKDMGQPPTSKHSIDRIDNSKGYNPKNCRWVTPKQQSRNKRNNKMISYKNEIKCVAEWCDIFSLPQRVVLSRINNLHWSAEKALTTPIRKCKRKEKNT